MKEAEVKSLRNTEYCITCVHSEGKATFRGRRKALMEKPLLGDYTDRRDSPRKI